MNITCPHCQTKLTLPDDKIPKDRDSSFKCPKCRESVQIKAGKTDGSPSDEPAAMGEGLSHGADVLVCVTGSRTRGKILAAAERSGWKAEAAPFTDQALEWLEYEIFPLMIMDETFDDKGAMTAYLNELDMSLRRRICLVRISSGVKTGDPMLALHTSNNFVINAKDVAACSEDELCSLLVSAKKDHDNFYRVYNDSMRAVGKA